MIEAIGIIMAVVATPVLALYAFGLVYGLFEALLYPFTGGKE
jgi:hypothetical protein